MVVFEQPGFHLLVGGLAGGVVGAGRAVDAPAIGGASEQGVERDDRELDDLLRGPSVFMARGVDQAEDPGAVADAAAGFFAGVFFSGTTGVS